MKIIVVTFLIYSISLGAAASEPSQLMREFVVDGVITQQEYKEFWDSVNSRYAGDSEKFIHSVRSSLNEGLGVQLEVWKAALNASISGNSAVPITIEQNYADYLEKFKLNAGYKPGTAEYESAVNEAKKGVENGLNKTKALLQIAATQGELEIVSGQKIALTPENVRLLMGSVEMKFNAWEKLLAPKWKE